MSDEKSHILHVIPSLHIGGAERCLERLAVAQAAEGTNSTVVTLLPRTGSLIETELARSGIEVLSLDMIGPWGFPLAALKLANLIRARKPRAVQSWLHYGDLSATAGLVLSGRRSQTRLIWGVRSSDLDFTNYSNKLELVAKICARLSPMANVIASNSEAGKKAHVALGYAEKNFETVYNGIDIDRFTPLSQHEREAFRKSLSVPIDSFLVVMAARLDPQKDYGTFLKVADRLPDFQFVVAGSRTQALPDRENVQTLGLFNNMVDLFGSADCVLSTSAYGEGFQNTIAEAMACGTPAVATNVGDAAVIIGETGYLAERADVVGLAKAIQMLADEPLTDRLARRDATRRRILEQFGLAEMVRHFARLQNAA